MGSQGSPIVLLCIGIKWPSVWWPGLMKMSAYGCHDSGAENTVPRHVCSQEENVCKWKILSFFLRRCGKCGSGNVGLRIIEFLLCNKHREKLDFRLKKLPRALFRPPGRRLLSFHEPNPPRLTRPHIIRQFNLF